MSLPSRCKKLAGPGCPEIYFSGYNNNIDTRNDEEQKRDAKRIRLQALFCSLLVST
jgi:hypothetical protein